MTEIDFNADEFADIVSRDHRYDARAYAVLADVIHRLGGEHHDRHMSAFDIVEEFRDTVLDQYGPLSFRVVTEWGLKSCEDIGEMMFNLVESKRVSRDDDDTPESFLGGYDFREAFLSPYEP